MKAQRYQRGSLSLRKRKSLPDVWEFRHYEEGGTRPYLQEKIVGPVTQFPSGKTRKRPLHSSG